VIYDTSFGRAALTRSYGAAWCASGVTRSPRTWSPSSTWDRKLPACRAAPIHARRRAAVLVTSARGEARRGRGGGSRASRPAARGIGQRRSGSRRARGMVTRIARGCGTPRSASGSPRGRRGASGGDAEKDPLRAAMPYPHAAWIRSAPCRGRTLRRTGSR